MTCPPSPRSLSTVKCGACQYHPCTALCPHSPAAQRRRAAAAAAADLQHHPSIAAAAAAAAAAAPSAAVVAVATGGAQSGNKGGARFKLQPGTHCMRGAQCCSRTGLGQRQLQWLGCKVLLVAACKPTLVLAWIHASGWWPGEPAYRQRHCPHVSYDAFHLTPPPSPFPQLVCCSPPLLLPSSSSLLESSPRLLRV